MSDEWPTTDLGKLETLYGPLAESIRRLVDVSIRTTADPATVAAAKIKIDSAAMELNASAQPGPFGVQRKPDGSTFAWGNAVIGLRNPLAPPLTVHQEPDGRVWCEFVLGAPYEGPPGHVHGGVCAMLLDHVLGAAASTPERRTYTGTLILRYVRKTELGRPLRAEAYVERVDGAKTFATGLIADEEGPTVEAEGIFIHPKQPPPF
jgi:acyl-coenzyme A thioesterase PaaI-like protein